MTSATGSAVDMRVTELMSSSGPLVVTEPVIMEILAGARSDRRSHLYQRNPYHSTGI
ncbi:MAG: hypothetical protein M0Z45_11040 [Actinomycetota bacterium]|nr:hypothetical protein [Actinomycetota bacterium]